MSLLPRAFWNDPLDLFDNSFKSDVMKTDITEKDGEYYLTMDLPGFDKKDIHIDMNNGYLTIRAGKSEETEENENYIRRERYYGEYSRSFYVGDVHEEDIKAKYKDGILRVQFPKGNAAREERKQITIED